MKRRARRIEATPKRLKYTARIGEIAGGFGYQIPPDPMAVLIYFDQKEVAEQAKAFFDHYRYRDWKTDTGYPIRNWKVAASDWIFDHQQQLKLSERQKALH